MRRVAVLAVFVAAVACVCAPPAEARGLYKGHGRISQQSQYNPFDVRLNGALGWHGAYKAKGAEYYQYPGTYYTQTYSFSDWQYGYYASAGLEFNLGKGTTLEPYGLYRVLEATDNYREIVPEQMPLDPSPGASSYLYQSVESKVYAAGVNLRFYQNWNGGAAYVGFGGGYAHGEAVWAQTGNGEGLVETQQDSGDFHLMTGLDLHLSALSLGFEVGWRWSGLEDFNEFEGGFLGARAGLMFGEGD